MFEILCSCIDELATHNYVTDNKTFEEGYICLNCSTFKPLNNEGDFDETTKEI